ncbi:uncharacterized protein [Panulirus ornatus]|uniref:uncharacterized protein isoform X2 n=1 Tax=Panulirus ornatus TaxID=150431 RepID=UPI003A8AEE01
MRASVSWYGCCILLMMAHDPGQGVTHTPPTPTAAPDRCRKCPYFLSTPTHITTPVGAAANLTCGVRTLGDRKVSWIRRRDLHVLTTDSFTYTTDTRFRAVHAKSSPYWVLSVSSPSVSDSGVYECQVSAQPKIFKRFTLDVIEPEARILGSDAVYMRAGSDLNITCIISGATPKTASVTWYHVPTGLGISGGRSSVVEEVNSGGRGGVQLVTDRRAGTSWLLVTRATRGDAGNYTCAPARARHASVVVHVLEDETPAAMQPHRQATDAPPPAAPLGSSSSSSSSSAGAPSSVVSSTRALVLISLLRLFFKIIYFPRDCGWLCSCNPLP